jgi:hypothetical protein
MRRYEHAVWVIKTRMGDALRAADEPDECALEAEEGRSQMMFAKEDLPDRSRTQSKVCNVCGYVVGRCKLLPHAAWRTERSALGHFSEAYTLRAGNLLFLHGKLVFKGATNCMGVKSTIGRLTAFEDQEEEAQPTLKAYLIVVSAFLCKNLFVHQCCLLEQMLSRVPWCRVVTRHEELSNAVLFKITDWSHFKPSFQSFPDLCLVSVSRRGVINARLGWHAGVEWTGNEEWLRLVDAVRDFVHLMC